MDLFQTARDNEKHLEGEFDRLAASVLPPAADLLRQFAADVAAHGRISINMRPWIAADFVQSDRYYNMYESVAEAASLSGRTQDEILRERLRAYFTRRTGFDGTFDDGNRFQYGTLNIGGAGTRRYGTICVVMNAGFTGPRGRVAYLKTDSLNGYTDARGAVDVARLGCDVATESHRQFLAALKHAREIESRCADWARMLCTDSEYVEVVLVADIRVSLVSEVRVAASDYRLLWDLCFNAHGGPVAEGNQALAHAFRILMRADKDNRIRLCEVADV